MRIIILIGLLLSFPELFGQLTVKDNPRQLRAGTLIVTATPAGAGSTTRISPDSVNWLKAIGGTASIGISPLKNTTMMISGEYLRIRSNLQSYEPIFGVYGQIRYFFSKCPPLLPDSAPLSFALNRLTPFVSASGGAINAYLTADREAITSPSLQYPVLSGAAGLRILVFRRLHFTQVLQVIVSPANEVNRTLIQGGFGIEWYIPTNKEDLDIKRAYWKSCAIWPMR